MPAKQYPKVLTLGHTLLDNICEKKVKLQPLALTQKGGDQKHYPKYIVSGICE